MAMDAWGGFEDAPLKIFQNSDGNQCFVYFFERFYKRGLYMWLW